MLEILYRVYRVLTDEERAEKLNADNSFSMFGSYSNMNNEELCMDCFICETREDFKEHIRAIYGKDTKFVNSKKYAPNTIYCIIIGEHCYNAEKYFNRIEFECDFCHSIVKGYVDSKITIDNYELKNELANQFELYKNKKFCSHKCKNAFIEIEKSKFCDEDIALNSFITRDMFTNNNLAGYIYKITKKSTNEFYVGQTVYVPIFRWGQHLKTERFDIKNILDYKFEVIELVPKNENILEREKYWIQKLYKEQPNLSLNIMQTANLITDKNQLKKEIYYDRNERFYGRNTKTNRKLLYGTNIWKNTKYDNTNGF